MTEKPDEGAYRDSETALGGADAVEKTSYVTGRGTDPRAMDPEDAPVAHPPAGGGVNVIAWIVGALAIVVALVYLVGVLRH